MWLRAMDISQVSRSAGLGAYFGKCQYPTMGRLGVLELPAGRQDEAVAGIHTCERACGCRTRVRVRLSVPAPAPATDSRARRRRAPGAVEEPGPVVEGGGELRAVLGSGGAARSRATSKASIWRRKAASAAASRRASTGSRRHDRGLARLPTHLGRGIVRPGKTLVEPPAP